MTSSATGYIYIFFEDLSSFRNNSNFIDLLCGVKENSRCFLTEACFRRYVVLTYLNSFESLVLAECQKGERCCPSSLVLRHC